MRWILVFLMAMHGVAHLVGFVGALRLAPEKVPYRRTTMLGNLSDNAMRMIGVMWAVSALAFLMAAFAAARNAPGWSSAALVIAGGSFALCILTGRDALVGTWLNVALVMAIIGGRAIGWL
jgi:hypothetical protein